MTNNKNSSIIIIDTAVSPVVPSVVVNNALLYIYIYIYNEYILQ